MSNNEEEVDLFDLSVEQSESGVDETETNVFSIEFDHAPRKVPSPMSAAPQPMPSIVGKSGGAPKLDLELDLDAEDFSTPAPVKTGIVFGGGVDDFDDDFDVQKTGITQKIACVIGGLFGGRSKSADDFDDDFSDLDDMPDADIDDDFSDLDDLPDADDDSFEFGVKSGGDEEEFDLSTASADGEATDVFEAPESAYETAVVEKFEISQSAAFDEEPSFEAAAEESEPEFELDAAAEEEPQFEAVIAPAPKIEPLPPPVFNRIAHVCLNVSNLETSMEFYEKLGFRRRFAFNRNGEIFGVYLEFGKGNFVEIFEDRDIDLQLPQNRLAHFCLETDDLDAVTASLDSRGIGYTSKKLGCDGTYQIWLKDPDGNQFEVHQYTPDSSQIVGKDVEADW